MDSNGNFPELMEAQMSKRKTSYQLGFEHGKAGLAKYPHRKTAYQLPNKRYAYSKGYEAGCQAGWELRTAG